MVGAGGRERPRAAIRTSPAKGDSAGHLDRSGVCGRVSMISLSGPPAAPDCADDVENRVHAIDRVDEGRLTLRKGTDTIATFRRTGEGRPVSPLAERPKTGADDTSRTARIADTIHHVGAVAKWPKAVDCKSTIPGSNPGGASSRQHPPRIAGGCHFLTAHGLATIQHEGARWRPPLLFCGDSSAVLRHPRPATGTIAGPMSRSPRRSGQPNVWLDPPVPRPLHPFLWPSSRSGRREALRRDAVRPASGWKA